VPERKRSAVSRSVTPANRRCRPRSGSQVGGAEVGDEPGLVEEEVDVLGEDHPVGGGDVDLGDHDRVVGADPGEQAGGDRHEDGGDCRA
jgi:hypothetical protein